jgi:hypothetical protein
MIKKEEAQPDPDEGKDSDYIQRRNWLLDRMKRQRWDLEDEKKPQNKRGRKPAPPPTPNIDQTKPRNKFFKFD